MLKDISVKTGTRTQRIWTKTIGLSVTRPKPFLKYKFWEVTGNAQNHTWHNVSPCRKSLFFLIEFFSPTASFQLKYRHKCHLFRGNKKKRHKYYKLDHTKSSFPSYVHVLYKTGCTKNTASIFIRNIQGFLLYIIWA